MLFDRSKVVFVDGNLDREEGFTAPLAFTHSGHSNTTRDSCTYDLLKTTLVDSAMRAFH
jgi:hypothetical protein